MAEAKVGQTGTFFKPGQPHDLGEFVPCRVLEIRGERLYVELEDGSKGEIQADAFAPKYMWRQG